MPKAERQEQDLEDGAYGLAEIVPLLNARKASLHRQSHENAGAILDNTFTIEEAQTEKYSALGNSTFHSIDDHRSVNTQNRRANMMLLSSELPMNTDLPVGDRQMTSVVIQEQQRRIEREKEIALKEFA